jgi:hypothetical protein
LPCINKISKLIFYNQKKHQGGNMGLFNTKKDIEESKENKKVVVQSSAALLHKEGKPTPKLTDGEDAPKTANESKFSDLYITPDKTCYVWSGKSNSSLKDLTPIQ